VEAMFQAVEGAEDDRAQGARDLLALEPSRRDVVLALAASGTTPYVLGAIQAAREVGALTIGIANNPGAPVAAQAEYGITLDTGNEIISGSTRLKAGTSQKIVLNTISSAIMVRLHKVYGNLMVDLKPTNAKLMRRALSLTMHATGADEAQARTVLEQCHYHVKVAIVALIKKINTNQAQALLAGADGSVRAALAA
ncbi:MAG: N-acetylmuramic acid 6-phosphate etherase, partial [Janthinobacterium sp.]